MAQSRLEAGCSAACLGQSPRLALGLPTSPGLTAPLFCHRHPVSRLAPVWFWFFSHSYLFNKENSAVLREKKKKPLHSRKICHISIKAFYPEMKGFLPVFPSSALSGFTFQHGTGGVLAPTTVLLWLDHINWANRSQMK